MFYHTYTRHIKLCVLLYLSSSSSSCYAPRTDFSGPLPPSFSIVHRSRRSSTLHPVLVQSCCM